MNNKFFLKIDKFNPYGMSDDELLSLAQPLKFKRWSFFDSEAYGASKWIKNYVGYPQCLPFRFLYEHGPNQWDIPMPHLKTLYSWKVGFYSKRLTDVWNSQRIWKNGIQILSPFVLYRKVNNIHISDNAKGTLIFHHHSTEWSKYYNDIDSFINEIHQKLPEKFFPISVCLHYCDVRNEILDFYRKHSIPCYTAGHWANPYFLSNFYTILQNFRFSVSNGIGSQALYSTEMGIPYSIIGEPPVLVNSIDDNRKATNNKKHTQESKCYNLFYGVNDVVKSECYDFCYKELGLDSNVGLSKYKKIIWSCLIFSLITEPIIYVYRKLFLIYKNTLYPIKYLIMILIMKDSNIDIESVSFKQLIINKLKHFIKM